MKYSNDLQAILISIISPIIKDSITENFENYKKQNSVNKEFYTVKEFAAITGIKYPTVVYRCKNQRLKARQDGPNCSWQILASEVERYKNETNN
jgi:hypothetical protein